LTKEISSDILRMAGTFPATFERSVEHKRAVALERIRMTIAGSFNQRYLPAEGRERILAKYFQEFPWLWAISPEWSGSLLIQVSRATREVLGREWFSGFCHIGGHSISSLWIKAKTTSGGQFVRQIQVKAQQGRKITLASLVHDLLAEYGQPCEIQIEFLVEAKEIEAHSASAMHDAPDPALEYQIYKPPKGAKSLNGICLEVAGCRQ